MNRDISVQLEVVGEFLIVLLFDPIVSVIFIAPNLRLLHGKITPTHCNCLFICHTFRPQIGFCLALDQTILQLSIFF